MSSVSLIIIILILLIRELPYINLILNWNFLLIYPTLFFLAVIPYRPIVLFISGAITLLVVSFIADLFSLGRLAEQFGVVEYIVLVGIYIQMLLYGKTISTK